jgi:hypothetical protein
MVFSPLRAIDAIQRFNFSNRLKNLNVPTNN